MDTELIKSIISLVIAIIPLLIVIVTFLNSRNESTTEPIDTALQVTKIVRYPLKEKDWKTIKYGYRILFLFLAFGYVGISVASIVGQPPLLIKGFNLAFVFAPLGLVVAFFLSYMAFNWYLTKPKNSFEGRYFLFTHADIMVESNFNYLFTKCLGILRSMKLNVVEVDEQAGMLEAQENRRGRETVKVQIEKVENSKNSYYVRFTIVKNDRNNSPPYYPPHSRVTNLFINKLVSKPKDIEEKPQTKRETGEDVAFD